MTKLVALLTAAILALSIAATATAKTPLERRQAATIAKQAKTIKTLKAQATRQRALARQDLTSRVSALTPDDAWALVSVIASRMSGPLYSSSVFVSNDGTHDYTSWTITRSVFTFGEGS